MKKTLNKILEKRKITNLIKEFLVNTPDFSACWILNGDGKCFIGLPNKTNKDFSSIIKKIDEHRKTLVLSDCIVSPIFVKQEVKGYIAAQTNQKNVPQHLQAALKFLSSVITEFSIFENEKKAVIQDTLNKYREITLLYSMSESFSSCLELKQIAQLVLETSRNVVKAERGSVMLLNPDREELEVIAVNGYKEDIKKLKMSEGIAGHVFKTGKPAIVNDVNSDPRFVQGSGKIKSLICAPLKANDKILGVVNVSNNQYGGMFTANDEKFLTTLATQAATAIENANLISKLKARNKELETALGRVQLLEKVKGHLSKFVPQSVQEMIDDNPDKPCLEKRDKDVTVVFLDIAGYTKMSESLDQTKVNYLIETYFSSFLDAIYSNNGDISETAGDGLMLIFHGADFKKNAIQAAQTALAIRIKTEQINRELQGKYDPVLVNIGVNSGIASVGSTKFEGLAGTRWTYTASGSVTNVAARIGAFAKGGVILVSEETCRWISDHFILKNLGEQQFKNVTKPTTVFRLIDKK